MNTPRKALILATVWPEPESSAAGWRLMSVIDALREKNWEMIVGSPCVENEFSARLRGAGIPTHATPINDPGFDAWIAAEDFDLAILDRFIIEEQFGWRISEFSPRTLRVLDTVDLHFLRRARQEALKRGVDLQDIFDDRIELHTDDTCREIASIYRSDLTLLVSDHELTLLRERFKVPGELLRLFRFCMHEAPATTGFSERRDFVSIGNFRHPPNADAARWLKTELWPKIRARLREPAELHLYGAYPPREIMDLSSPKEGFIVQGPATDAHATLARYRVNLAPLRFGAGIKGKIADGWQAGTPVVTTPIGAEGMRLGEIFGGMIARDADEFSSAAVELYHEASAWQEARNQGQQVLRGLFDRSETTHGLHSAINEAITQREERRRANFVGRMLGHHTLRSTKYFARWIELKEAHEPRPQ